MALQHHRRDDQANLRNINLNLLPVLGELLRLRSVTAAAEILHMTQSGVSDALARLRLQFADELLVKVGRRMVPTPFAIGLAPLVYDALSAAESVFKQKHVDPLTTARTFTIASSDSVALAIGQGLLKRLERGSPRSTVQFVTVESPLRAKLEDGSLDLLIIPRGKVPSSVFNEDGLGRMHLTWETVVCIARADHPELTRGLTTELLNSLQSIAIKGDSYGNFFAQLPGRTVNDALHVQEFMLHPMLVVNSDAIAITLRRAAEWFAQFLPIRIHELPIALPRYELCAYWSAFQRNDAMHIWLREQIQEMTMEEGNPWFS